MRYVNQPPTILMVDDDPDYYCLFKDAMMENGLRNEFVFVSDGDELMDYLSRRGKYKGLKNSSLPGFILLDLNMPGKDGCEILRDVKSDPAWRSIPVVIFTASTDTEDIAKCYSLGASSFISKPGTFQSMIEIIGALEEYWLKVVKLPMAF